MESWYGILKKETLHNNNIISLQEYKKTVEEWILFYNTDRLKSKKGSDKFLLPLKKIFLN